MLSTKVTLHDILDVEAFVIMCLKRSGCHAPQEHWEELIAEGLCLLYVMASNYKPQLEGYDKAGKFSGYAIKWLPKQIAQAWHRSRENHLLVTDIETKKRRWSYKMPPTSYEMIIGRDNEHGYGTDEIRMMGINDFVDVPIVE